MSNGLAGGIDSIARYYQMLQLAKQQAKLQEAAEKRREAVAEREWSPGRTEGIASVRESRLPEPGSLPPLRAGRDLPSLPLPRFDPFAGVPEVRGGISAPPGAERVTMPEGWRLASAKALEDVRTKASIAQERAGYPFALDLARLPYQARATEKEEERRIGAEQLGTAALNEMDTQIERVNSDMAAGTLTPEAAKGQLQLQFKRLARMIQNESPSRMSPEAKRDALAKLNRNYAQAIGVPGWGLEQMLGEMQKYDD